VLEEVYRLVAKLDKVRGFRRRSDASQMGSVRAGEQQRARGCGWPDENLGSIGDLTTNSGNFCRIWDIDPTTELSGFGGEMGCNVRC
jgi:hypothetical protein